MESQQMENQQRQKLSQISRDEVDVINDIRELNFGRINIIIQDGVIMSKEITRVVRRNKNRNNKTQNNNRDSGEYNNEEEIY
ncbi:MAG: DUF2292 domain-containing protein [Candidatus Pacebacteria bacterium]|nr:DUF2292 domain-containing protein [Candidatus Paceibacterota bacterium]